MKKNSAIYFEFPSEKQVEIFLQALLPETRKPATSRSKVSLKKEGKKLLMTVDAKDTSALRATLNSYLRWITLVKNTCDVVANLEKSNQMKNT